MIDVGILGYGHYLPSQELSNFDMEKMVDTSDEWIRTRTGIVKRRRAAVEQATSDLASAAAKAALASAGLAAEDIDLIIVATVTPDMSFPSSACLVQAEIGATRAAAFDLSAACTGFMYGLSVAHGLIAQGVYKHCLVIGAETLSRIVDYADRNTCVLFGDGAGAVVLGPSRQRRLLGYELGADGTGAMLLAQPAGGSRLPATTETLAARKHFVHMDGQEVFRFAVSKLPEVSTSLLNRLGYQVADIDWLIPHQANKRIIESAVKRLGLSCEKTVVNLDQYGNMSSASIPVALSESAERGRFRVGDKLLLVGFGGGLTWGAAMVEW